MHITIEKRHFWVLVSVVAVLVTVMGTLLVVAGGEDNARDFGHNVDQIEGLEARLTELERGGGAGGAGFQVTIVETPTTNLQGYTAVNGVSDAPVNCPVGKKPIGCSIHKIVLQGTQQSDGDLGYCMINADGCRFTWDRTVLPGSETGRTYCYCI